MFDPVFDGRQGYAWSLSSFTSTLPVPPGKYTIEVGNQKMPLELVEGQRMEIDVP